MMTPLHGCLATFALLAGLSTIDARTASPGGITYHVDPAGGADDNPGRSPEQPWKTFAPLNRLKLAPGDRIEVSPGRFDHSLELTGAGTAEQPIEVHFAAGRHDFHPTHLFRDTFNISNTNAEPEGLKAVALMLRNVKHAHITGPGARIVCHAKMIEVCVDHCEDITLEGLAFDYQRPTVSEFKVVETGPDHAILKIHQDSAYSIAEGKLTWTGEGWSHGEGLGQELDLSTGRVHRMRSPLGGLTAEEKEPFTVRVTGKHRLKQDRIYQIRDPHRDCAGVFTRRSKDILWKDVKFHFIHGMGIVSQFTENITLDGVSVAPDPDSGRTTAAWADCFHFSGCRGKILVRNCVFSGAHDDAINVHGTHLRVVEKLGPNKVKVAFIHKQTFGFLAFNPGDEVDFVHADTLEPYATNQVITSKLINPREIELVLDKPVPAELRDHDVIENVTWTPEVEVRGCEVRHIPTRGFLFTTRRKVVVEDNDFHATHMSAILLENDAEGWFESGCIRDLTIRNNRFHQCGEPVVKINPRNSQPNPAVHRNIRIEDNTFLLRGQVAVGAHSTTGLSITGNAIHGDPLPTEESAFRIERCGEVTLKGNRFLPVETE
ncbi:right-handed parallel beta-helix repeat-containing protein [Haloferula sp. A504]|uniref:right-handed parallel beta-helix repeat-containing protein n=1 Tax=Haloferula sp. A504 TaxID=3373601 RepID=UPI0031C77C01|nr:right-handed parallel beta-helix repeat-containing protein [Verrucomicrobiaceae bacterium E54]